MQCPSCRFENMPQYTICVRCGSILPGSETHLVNVAPPRAGKWEKRLHVSTWIWSMNRFFGLVGGFTRTGFGRFLHCFRFRSANLSTASLFWRGAIPGLPQWYIGRKRLAKMFFWGWLGMLLLAMLTFGLSVSAVFLGLAFSCHLSSIIDIIIVTCHERSDRLALFSTMVTGAILLFYLPTSGVLWNHLGSQGVTAIAGPLRDGDTLLFTRSWRTIRPRAGDIVLYMAPDVVYPLTGQGHGYNRLIGNMFDRVLAVEGQTITWKKGELLIDGFMSPCQPFIPLRTIPPDTTFVVPKRCCYIVPGVAFQRLQMPVDATHWRDMGIVQNESLYGRVWGARRTLFHFVDLDSTEKKE